MFRQTTSNKLWGQVNGMTVNCKETGTPPALLPVVSPWLSCPLTSQNLISSVCGGGCVCVRCQVCFVILCLLLPSEISSALTCKTIML